MHGVVVWEALLDGSAQIAAGVVAGLGIGTRCVTDGVLGGELLIPPLVHLFGLDLNSAGSLALAISKPTKLVGFARYSRDDSFAVLGRNGGFVALMAVGSIIGVAIGG